MKRFKLDENLPSDVAALLCEAGHDACTVNDQGLGGASDGRVAEVCKLENRAIVTLDLDFSNIRAYPPEQFAGLIVLRVARQDANHIRSVVRSILPQLERESLVGCLWIVEESRLRIWRGPDVGDAL